MRILKGIGALLVFGAVAAGVTWVLIQLGAFVWGKFAALDPTVSAGLVTASATVVVSVTAITLGRYFERRRELIEVHRDKKVVFYDDFLSKWFDLVSEGGVEEAAGDDLVDFVRDLQRKIILWSGPQVVKTYTDWSRLIQAPPLTVQAMFKMEEFYFAMRRDLGQSNRGLKKGDLLRLTMKHPEILLAAAAKNPDVLMDDLAALEKKLHDEVEDDAGDKDVEEQGHL